MKHSVHHIRKVHQFGALLTLIGFSLGISFTVLMAVFGFLGESVIQIALDLIAIPIMGLLAFLIGMQLKSYRRPEALDRPLLDHAESEEVDLDHWRDRRRERILSEKKDDLEV